MTQTRKQAGARNLRYGAAGWPGSREVRFRSRTSRYIVDAGRHWGRLTSGPLPTYLGRYAILDGPDPIWIFKRETYCTRVSKHSISREL